MVKLKKTFNLKLLTFENYWIFKIEQLQQFWKIG